MPVRFAVNRPIATLMLSVALLLFGLFAAVNLPVGFLPSVSVPTLVISASYPGASPEEVRRLVAIPLEDALASMKGIRSLRSVSRRGASTVTLDFQWGTDMLLAGVRAREIIDGVYARLPQGADRPRVVPTDPNASALMVLSVSARDMTVRTARAMADREVKTALQRIDGVGSVVLIGGFDREVEAAVDQPRMAAAGLALSEIASFLASANVDLPAGSIVEGTREYLVRTDARMATPEALADLRIRAPAGQPIRLGELAKISWHPGEQRSLFLVDGRESVGLVIHGRPGASPPRLSKYLRSEIARLGAAYADSLSISVVEDASSTVVESLRGLLSATLLGAAAAFLVMLLFLRRLRPALILITAVPASVLFCLLLLWVTGRGINLMSLAGIALSIGMLVDDGVVVLENLERRLGCVPAERLREGIVEATSEVSGCILGSTLTTMIVFLPVLFLPGLLGALYADLALSVLFSLFASLVVSATLVPVLFLITRPAAHGSSGEALLRQRPIERGYRRTLGTSLRRPAIVGCATALAGAAALPLVLAVRLELVEPFDGGTVEVRMTAPPATSMEELKRIAMSASKRMLAVHRVASVWCRAGGESDDLSYFADDTLSRETISFVARTAYGRKPDTPPVAVSVRRVLAGERADLAVGLPRSAVSDLLGLRGGGGSLLALGPSPEGAVERARAAVEKLSAAAGSAAVRVALPAPIRELHCTPDRARLAHYGFDLAALAQTVDEQLEGAIATRLTADGRDYDVRVRIAPEFRLDQGDLESLKLRSQAGSPTELGSLVRIAERETPSVLVRENRRDAVAIQVELAGPASPTLADALAELRHDREIVDADRTLLEEHAPEVALVFVVALLLLYFLLAAQFESFVQPLIILVAVPLAATGVLAALVVTGRSLNLSSVLGVLVLFGTVVKVSIILFANYRRRIDGKSPVAFAIYTGTSERLRPILISTLATVGALLPVAVNWNGLSTEAGIATAVIGGLVVSTALTLYVVPLLSWGYYRRLMRGSATPGPLRGSD